MKISPKNTLIFGVAIEVALIAITLIAYQIDSRLINDINIWTKPLKFQFSQMILLLTFLWMLPLISEEFKKGKLVRYGVNLLTIAGTFEVFYITLQSARGLTSHFNNNSKIEAIAYSIMGVGAVMMVIGCFLYGVAILKSKIKQGQLGFQLGSAWGLMLGAVLTLITASILANGSGHWVGGIKSDLNGLPLVGWSTTGGDLRVPHFFATHMMQAMPLLGLIVDKFMPLKAKLMIGIGSAFGIAVVFLTYQQAMAGKPLF
jgi:hypothetical protein